MKAAALILPFLFLAVFCSRGEPPAEPDRPQTPEEVVGSIRKEVGRIQALALVKLSYGKPNLSGCGSSVEDIYIDDRGRVRRLEFQGTCSPAAYLWEERIEYFNGEGDLVHLLFVNYNGPLTGTRGSAFFSGGKAVRTYSIVNGETISRPKAPVQEFNATAQGIVKRLGIAAGQVSKGRRVSLRLPVKNDTAIINTNDVMIRSAPSRTGRRLNDYKSDGRLPREVRYSVGAHVFSRAKVLDIGPEETIEPWGTHRWYRVKVQDINMIDDTRTYTGWIFGAFLEPVAR